jgi:hypothetical protein
MRTIAALAILSASLFVEQPCAAMPQAAPLSPQGTASVLPPPPEPGTNYDPRPGPYGVPLTTRGEVSDDRYWIIGRALENWHGAPFQAFQICYHPPEGRHEPVDLEAMKKVAGVLKALGAEAVVMTPDEYCDGASPHLKERRAYVLIMGVIQL